ncbi:hypothetical protein [Kitasatospora sp. NPDC097691]|uniref:hypothetical protein n=1 Tax=Kitasatospora sp. NPDC097691 TaxID=3157231 RepID=UPI0033300676
MAIATIGAALALAPAASPGGAPMRIGYFSDSPLPEGSVPLTQLPPEPRQQLASPSPGTPGVRG